MMAGAAGMASAQDQPTQKINKKNLSSQFDTDIPFLPEYGSSTWDTWVFALPERIMFIIADKYADLFRIINITSESYL